MSKKVKADDSAEVLAVKANENFSKLDADSSADQYLEVANLFVRAGFRSNKDEGLYKDVMKSAAECFFSSAKREDDKMKAVALYAYAGEIYHKVMGALGPDNLVSECNEGGVCYAFSDTLPGKAWGAYLQASLSALVIGEHFEVKNELKNAALFYGAAGDYYFSQYVVYSLLPESHLFASEKEEHDYLFKAAECYMKSAKMSIRHGVPVTAWLRISEKHAVFSDFFDRNEFVGGRAVIKDEDKAIIIYNFLEKTKKYEVIASRRLKAISLTNEFTEMNSEIAIFESEIRAFIDTCMPNDLWLDAFSTDFKNRIQQNIEIDQKWGKVALEKVKYLEFSHYSEIIMKHWDKRFSSIFGKKNQHGVKEKLVAMAKVYRNPMYHTRDIDVHQKGLFIVYAKWFQSFFDSVKPAIGLMKENDEEMFSGFN